MTATEVGTLFSNVGLLTGTVTVQQWDGDSWEAVAGWGGVAATISGKGVDKVAHVPAGLAARPSLSVPLKATIVSPGLPAGPYACRFLDDVGSQGLVWRVGLWRLGSSGGSQWTVLEERGRGITSEPDANLGTITAYKAAPVEPKLVTGEGNVQVQRDTDVMLIPMSAGVDLEQGHVLQSVADPTLRFRLMTLDLLDEIDDTYAPYWLEATLEPA